MSVGVGKCWRRWRNQSAAGNKQEKQAQELKDRFGHRFDPTIGKPKQGPSKAIKRTRK